VIKKYGMGQRKKMSKLHQFKKELIQDLLQEYKRGWQKIYERYSLR
jgi:hypothetical protein